MKTLDAQLLYWEEKLERHKRVRSNMVSSADNNLSNEAISFLTSQLKRNTERIDHAREKVKKLKELIKTRDENTSC